MTIRSTGFQVSHMCPHCNKVFSGSNARGDMYYHIAWAHPVHKVYLSDDKIIACEFCTAHVHMSDYTGHILARHPEEQ
jgi:hypothetical protein